MSSSFSITNTDKILHVGFSRNTAIILYDSISSNTDPNLITILEHLGDDKVAVVKEKASFGTIANAVQYRISASNCLCSSIRSFVCFSTNLKCVLLKKAGEVCNLIEISSYNWSKALWKINLWFILIPSFVFQYYLHFLISL